MTIVRKLEFLEYEPEPDRGDYHDQDEARDIDDAAVERLLIGAPERAHRPADLEPVTAIEVADEDDALKGMRVGFASAALFWVLIAAAIFLLS